MTITVQSLEDFIAELVAERENIADNIVRWQRNLSAEQKEAISFQVNRGGRWLMKCASNLRPCARR
jgi:hypothetical protein